jgi:hypothetical protein
MVDRLTLKADGYETKYIKEYDVPAVVEMRRMKDAPGAAGNGDADAEVGEGVPAWSSNLSVGSQPAGE